MILVNNAKDAIKSYKETIGQRDYPGLIRFDITKQLNTLKLSISDNGGGIDETILPRLFTPYLTTKGEQGTGIGLKLAKTIIEAGFGGMISARNSETGACFSIEIKLPPR